MFLILMFFLGSCFTQLLPALPSEQCLILVSILCVLAFSIWIYFYFQNTNTASSNLANCMLLFCSLLSGFLYTCFIANWYSAQVLPKNLECQNILIAGHVSSLVNNKSDHSSFDFTISAILRPSINTKFAHAKIHLSWYGEHAALKAGDKWQLLVRLKRPHAMLNPGGFDYERHLWQRHLRATGYVVSSDDDKLLFSSHPPWRYLLLRWRQHVALHINKILAHEPNAGVLNALVVGDQSEVNEETWQILRFSGTNYLLAIAGLHIGLAALAAFWAAQYLWRFSAFLMRHIPARIFSTYASISVAIFYSAISGFSMPTQRALAMLLIFSLAIICRRQTSVLNILFAALLVVIGIDPLATLTPGFWLSFAAVALIFYVTSSRLELSNMWWRKYLRMQTVLTIGLAPLTLLFFNQASLTAFIANIIALPAVCSIVVPLGLLGSIFLFIVPCLGKIFLLAGAKVMTLVFWWLKFLLFVAPFDFHYAAASFWAVITATIGIMLIFSPRGVNCKLAGIMWLLPFCCQTAAAPKFGEVWFNLLDVGQGLAATAQTAHHVLIYDTGPKYNSTDAGAEIVAPFLWATGIHSIDVLMVSHADMDHFGGAKSLMSLFEINTIISSAPEKFAPRVAQNCYAGQEWKWDGVDFRVLSPLADTAYAGNASSCVLRIDNGASSILLTGDIDKEQEQFLVKTAAQYLPATILVAPHHGSKGSSSEEFVHAVQPKFVLFPVGYNNRFHFPAAIISDRYQSAGSQNLETQATGTINFKLLPPAKTQKPASKIIGPMLYRILQQHYWYQ